MNLDRVQRPLLLVPRVSRQRWALIGLAVGSAAAASISTAIASNQNRVIFALIVVLAAASAISPDSHIATTTEVVVVVQWLASTGGDTTGWAIGVALCLFAFHAAIALMALTPVTTSLDRSILVRWSRRSVSVVIATLAMGALVWAMNERQASGSGALTAAGLAALAGLVLATRKSSTE